MSGIPFRSSSLRGRNRGCLVHHHFQAQGLALNKGSINVFQWMDEGQNEIGTMVNHPYSEEVAVGVDGKDLARVAWLAANSERTFRRSILKIPHPRFRFVSVPFGRGPE